MLDSLLTLLLPQWVTPVELNFHTQFVLTTYREYYDYLTGSGYRDRRVLSNIKKRTAYSMNMLLWRKPVLWWRIRRFHNQVMGLKNSVLPPEDVPEMLRTP